MVPDCYDRPDGNPIEVEVPVEVVRHLRAKGGNIRSYDRVTIVTRRMLTGLKIG